MESITPTMSDVFSSYRALAISAARRTVIAPIRAWNTRGTSVWEPNSRYREARKNA